MADVPPRPAPSFSQLYERYNQTMRRYAQAIDKARELLKLMDDVNAARQEFSDAKTALFAVVADMVRTERMADEAYELLQKSIATYKKPAVGLEAAADEEDLSAA
jgi:hypothetical protein